MPSRPQLLIVVLLMFALAAALVYWGTPADAAGTVPPVRIVWVEAPNRTITERDAVVYRAEIDLALDYWRAAGVPLADAAPAEHWITVDKPVTDWRFGRQFADPKWTTIVIVKAQRWDALDMGGGARAGGDSRAGVALCLTWNDHYAYEPHIEDQAVGSCVGHELWHLFSGLAAEGDPAVIDGQHAISAHPRWGRDDYAQLRRPHPSDAAIMRQRYP